MKKTIIRVLRHKPQVAACFIYIGVAWLVSQLGPVAAFLVNVFGPSGFIVLAFTLYHTRKNAHKRYLQWRQKRYGRRVAA